MQKTSLIPSEYQQVEYIQATGTQYIIVDSSETQSWFYDVTAEITFPVATTYNMMFGHSLWSDATAWCLYWDSSKVTVRRRNGTGTTYDAQTTKANIEGIKCRFILNDSMASIINADTNTTIVNNTLDASSLNRYNCPVRIFKGFSNNTGFEKNVAAKLYSFKVYTRNNVLTYDCIPCYRKSDNATGVYDTVHKTFFGNNGTGEFVIPT